MKLSDLICDLIDAKLEVVQFFKENERNPYRAASCEERLGDAQRAVDKAVSDITVRGENIT